jgi:superoxide dismutase, Fe-Mn family
MPETKQYVLPELPYAYNALEPYISEEQLRLHHDKHHKVYVKDANELLEKLVEARKEDKDSEIKPIAKGLSFNIGGHVLHSLFWENLRPAGKEKSEPKGKIKEIIDNEFGSFKRFTTELTKAATTCEGSGWAALSFCSMLKRPIIMQIEKHNQFINPAFNILLVLDVWEHAYYLDYKNERPKFVEAFWNIVNWDVVDSRIK